jgi:hypothetical protein
MVLIKAIPDKERMIPVPGYPRNLFDEGCCRNLMSNSKVILLLLPQKYDPFTKVGRTED